MGRRSSTTPSGDDPSRPVTLPRVAVALSALGLHCLYGEDRLVVPWNDHILVVRRLMPTRPSEPATLRFDMVLRQRLEMADMPKVAEVLNAWNQERLDPTVTMALQGDVLNTHVQFRAHSAVIIDLGLSDEQLATAVELGVDTSVLLTREMISQFPQLATEDSQVATEIRNRQDHDAVRGVLDGLPRPDEGLPAPISAEEAASRAAHPSGQSRARTAAATRQEFLEAGVGASPREVVVEHVQASLTAAGIEKQQVVDDLVLAWINGVLFAFYLDNGPSLLIRAFWEVEADPNADRFRLFLVCNDFNAKSSLVKSFTQKDRDGLQVRMEFTVNLSAGQNAAQLKHLVTVGMGQVMAAVDVISTEASGETAVEWPGQDG
ncbi:YbjN domain-containing protein [Corynebacterium guangdongense]|uniref:YbjN domain-containing protein n=1 Tax=Corynebacterium guangdongense TaxID=1783348 RepID=A0ABU1ZXM0_9CORY|nr:YbjN domain-containing protein [Corynebacterium guangdongense]MDR7329692.1 hypothetical protein [Corynebacterium guangdongense]WJZ18256.1 hypothetical protein CGUA_08475 [Corynebacterium guangdongense]